MQITTTQIRQELERRRFNKYDLTFTDDVRGGYSKHMQVLSDTAKFRQVCMMAANRVGKSELGAYAVATWATGNYPHWWAGKRFKGAVNIQVAGETGKLVRDSVQKKLLGEIGALGSGAVPKEFILSTTPKAGTPNAVDTVLIRHKLGGTSIIQFQSYDQGREAFQATERDVIWDDEEPPLDVYTEQLLRTMTTGGVVLSTFTPLKGVSETVLHLQAQA